MGDFVLQCNSLTKKFIIKKALDNVSFNIAPGKIVGLLGPNGSGKTTIMKLANGLISPTSGEVLIDGMHPCIETKRLVSYLPDQNYLNDHMRVRDLMRFFADFYVDFDMECAASMLDKLSIDSSDKLKILSKGTQEKIQLILVMSRRARLYLLDEPIGGVDPATRDFILENIIKRRNGESSVLIYTHLIADIEKILDEVIFIKNGSIILHESASLIREREGTSVDEYFREVFRC